VGAGSIVTELSGSGEDGTDTTFTSNRFNGGNPTVTTTLVEPEPATTGHLPPDSGTTAPFTVTDFTIAVSGAIPLVVRMYTVP
jgi:hypothetical protein